VFRRRWPSVYEALQDDDLTDRLCYACIEGR
jgi:hypothetical protein